MASAQRLHTQCGKLKGNLTNGIQTPQRRGKLSQTRSWEQSRDIGLPELFSTLGESAFKSRIRCLSRAGSRSGTSGQKPLMQCLTDDPCDLTCENCCHAAIKRKTDALLTLSNHAAAIR